MTLLLQTAGIIATGVALSAIIERRVSRSSVAAGAVAVVFVAASVLFWANLWDAGRTFNEAHAHNETMSGADAAVAGGVALAVDVGFVEWARTKIPAQDSYYLMPDEARESEGIYQWLSYQLFPRSPARTPDEADWLIFYDGEPRAGYDRAEFESPVRYAREFAIARRR